MGIVGEGENIPTKEEQEADLQNKQSELQAQQELHKKMRHSSTAEYARDKKQEEEQPAE